MVELVTVRVTVLKMPPPRLKVAVLVEIVELLTVRVPALKMPPPLLVAELPERVELEMLRLAPPALKMPPPPPFAVLPEMVELVTVRVPALLKAPPLPVICAPETVKPEMVKLPPASIEKILKLPLLASIVSEEAPGPVMVRVPAAPPIMVGSTPAKVMVPVSPVLKTISSLPGVVLAWVIAASRDPAPEAAVFRTVMVAGTILLSSWRSCGREEALRAFLFCALLKSLRKAFKSMERFLIPKPK